MIRTSASGLWEEVRTAKDRRDHSLQSMREQLRRYHGPAFDTQSGQTNEFDPVNQALMLLGILLPSVAYSNPRVKVGTRRPGLQRQDAEALGLALNRWIAETDLAATLEKLATDFAFTYGIGHVTREPRPGEQENADPLYWPQFNRIAQDACFWDPQAKSWELKRYAGHQWFIDHEDLIHRAEEDAKLPEDEQEGWNLDIIKQLRPGNRHRSYGVGDQDEDEDFVPRDDIEIHEVWLPEVELPEIVKMAAEQGKTPSDLGYRGSIYYLANCDTMPTGREGDTEYTRMRRREVHDKKSEFVRKPQPYFGPKRGPYIMFGAYYVPSESTPLGPLTATEPQTRSVNEIARALHDSARAYKRVLGVDELEREAVAAAINETGHNELVGLRLPETGKMQDAVTSVEVGGITEQQLAQFGLEREMLDQVSGLSEAQRGNITGATATENATAEAASNKRVEWLSQKFERSVKESLMSVAEYFWIDDEIVQPLGSEASQERQAGSLIYVGGNPDKAQLERLRARFPDAQLPDGPKDETGATFYDLELEIEPFSMARASESLRRAQGAFMIEFSTVLAPALPTLEAMGVDTEELLSMVGDQLGMPRLSRIVDFDELRQFAQMQMQMQIEQGQGKDANTSRLGRTTGGMSPHGGQTPNKSLPGGLNSTSPNEGNRSGAQTAAAAR